MLPESSSRLLLATLAQSCNLAHASLKTAVLHITPKQDGGTSQPKYKSIQPICRMADLYHANFFIRHKRRIVN